MITCYHVMLNNKPHFEAMSYESAKAKFDSMNESVKLTKDTYINYLGSYIKVKSEVLLEK